jgi:hypothetical protein
MASRRRQGSEKKAAWPAARQARHTLHAVSCDCARRECARGHGGGRGGWEDGSAGRWGAHEGAGHPGGGRRQAPAARAGAGAGPRSARCGGGVARRGGRRCPRGRGPRAARCPPLLALGRGIARRARAHPGLLLRRRGLRQVAEDQIQQRLGQVGPPRRRRRRGRAAAVARVRRAVGGRRLARGGVAQVRAHLCGGRGARGAVRPPFGRRAPCRRRAPASGDPGARAGARGPPLRA